MPPNAATPDCASSRRRQWTEKERLGYPIVQLPLALTAEEGGLFRERLFWIGLAAVGAYDFLNGMHVLYPIVPSLSFNGYDALQHFTARPWNAIGWTPLAVFPFIIGLGYLLPVDLLFSCWFFFLFWKVEKVLSSALGYLSIHPKFPFIDAQMFGAYMAVCAFALWTARSHLAAVVREAFRREGADAATRPLGSKAMQSRSAVLGLVAGLAFGVGFGNLAGLPVWLSVAFFGIYFAIAMAVTRMRAELGPPTHDLHFIGPDQTLASLLGTQHLGGHALGALTLFFWFNRAYRCHPMPHQLEGLKMAQQTRTSSRGLLGAMLLASLVGIVATFWVTLHVSYALGAATRIHGWSSLGFGTEAYNRLGSWLAAPTQPETGATFAIAVGFAMATALMVLRRSLFGWPFHVLGFALSGGWSMWWAWLSLFIAWALKGILLRYGGLQWYRKGLPFFYGVILGDFLVGGCWTIFGLVIGRPVYSLWSG